MVCFVVLDFQADVYTDSSGSCAAFLSNSDDKNDKKAVFRNTSYDLPAWSVSILPDCKNAVFNSAKVRKRKEEEADLGQEHTENASLNKKLIFNI